MYPQSMFWSKNKKNIKHFLLKIFNFYYLRNIVYITWACFPNEKMFETQFQFSVHVIPCDCNDKTNGQLEK